jgi:hypothetical protein
MGEYPSLTEYANVADGYEGIINETGTIYFRMFFDLRFRSLDEPFKNAYREANTINTAQSIEWIFSNEGKVMGRGIQTGISFNGKNFSVNYSVRI